MPAARRRTADPSDDSVLPVVEAAQVNWTAPGDVIAGHLLARDARGHTPGMLAMELSSAGRRMIFCGDVLHHPLHVLRPEWNSVVDVEKERAAATRATFLADVADRAVLVAPCHFAPPHCGFVRRRGAGYALEMAPSGAPLPASATDPWEDPQRSGAAPKSIAATAKKLYD